MSKNKFLKAGALSLATVFAGVAAPSGFAENAPENNAQTTIWENDEIGVVEIAPCEKDQSKFCGYLLATTPEAAKEFGLKVQNTMDDMRGLLVMSGFDPNSSGTKLKDGKFENTDNKMAKKADLTISYDGDVMNVRAKVGWFGDSFAFNKVDNTLQIAQATTRIPNTPKL